jgi:hypothetical protein
MLQVPLNKWQKEVETDTHRFKVICAGRRSGKSVLSRMIILKWAIEKPGVYWIVSPNYKQSKMIHWSELQKEVPLKWVLKKNEVDLAITLKNGSVIELKGAENPDSLRGSKLRGLVIDEIASIRNWDWLWQECLRPTLTDYEAPVIFISTPKGYNHFYDLYQQGQQDSIYKSWRFTSYDNPFIPKGEIDQAKTELTEDTFAQEYLADFRKYTGLVYKGKSMWLIRFRSPVDGIHTEELISGRPIQLYVSGLPLTLTKTGLFIKNTTNQERQLTIMQESSTALETIVSLYMQPTETLAVLNGFQSSIKEESTSPQPTKKSAQTSTPGLDLELKRSLKDSNKSQAILCPRCGTTVKGKVCLNCLYSPHAKTLLKKWRLIVGKRKA